MDLPNARATLTPRVAASDYVFFIRDLTDPAGLRRSANQTTGAFTRDYAGNLFRTGLLYCFCASSPTVGDDAQIGYFNAAGQAVVYAGQAVAGPVLTTIEQVQLAPAGYTLPLWARIGRPIRLKPALRDFSDDFSDDFD